MDVLSRKRDIFDEVAGPAARLPDVFDSITAAPAGKRDIFDQVLERSAPKASPSKAPPKSMPSLDGYRPGKIELNPKAQRQGPGTGDMMEELKGTAAVERAFPSVSGFQSPDLGSALESDRRSPAGLQAAAEREGQSPLSFGLGFVKGAAQGATGGTYRPTIYESEAPGATMGQFAGAMAPAALSPLAPEIIPMVMAGLGFMDSGNDQAQRQGGTLPGGELNPGETGFKTAAGGIMGALPGAAPGNLAVRAGSGGAIGALTAATDQAITQMAREGKIDAKDPEAVKAVIIQTAMGMGFGAMGGTPKAPGRGIEYRPEIPDQAQRIQINPQEGQPVQSAPFRNEGPSAGRVADIAAENPRGDIFDAITAQEPQGATRSADPSQVTAAPELSRPSPSQPARRDIFDQLETVRPAAAVEASKPPAEPTGPRDMPRDNRYSRPLKEYAPRLYRETDIDAAMAFLPHGTDMGFMERDRPYFAEVPEMALGQGENRGIRMEFDSEGIKGTVNLDKPGLDFAFQNRQGEFVGSGNSQGVYRKALRSFTILPGAKGSAGYTARLRNIGRWVEAEGWTKTKAADGSITYTRPEAKAPESAAVPLPVSGLNANTARPAAVEPSQATPDQAAALPKPPESQTGIAEQFAERAYQRGYTELDEITRAAQAGQAIKDKGLAGPELNRTFLESLDRDFPAQPERAPFVTPDAPAAEPIPQSQGAEPKAEAPRAATPRPPTTAERSFPKTLEKNGLPGGENRTYETKSNAHSVEVANAEIDAAGLDRSIEDVITETRPSAEHTTKGILLIKRLQELGDKAKASSPADAEAHYSKAIRVASELSQRLTEQGQAIQAASIVSRLSPDGIVLYAQRQIRKANAERLFPGKTPENVMQASQALQLRSAAKKVQELEGYVDESKAVSKILDRAGKSEPITAEDVAALKEYRNKIQGLIGEELKPAAEPRRPGIPKTPKAPGEKSFKESIIEALDKKEQAARARLKARGYRLYSGIPLDDLGDFAIIGASRIAKSGVRFSDWSAGMIKDFGEELRPHLGKVYTKANEIFQTEKARAAKLAANARAINSAISKIETNTDLGTEQAKALGEMVDQIKTLSGAAKVEAGQELQAALQALTKPTLGQKVATAQTISQLLNPKTAVRNILGNELFYRMERISKLVATPIDMARSSITGGERQITFRTEGQGDYWKAFMQGARSAAKGVNPEGIQSKYDLAPAAFSGKYNPLTYLERAMGVELKAFDYASYTRAKNQTLGELASLRADAFGIPAIQRRAFVEKWIAEADDRIHQIADDYGKYVTFQDDSGLAKAAQGIKTAANKATYAWQIENPRFGLGDIILKYPKTPANIFLRALDYSPAGFLRSAYQIAEPIVKGGERNVREIEMGLARAITGTIGFTGMGYYLASKGVISGRQEKDRDVRAFKAEQTGERNYQVNVSALERWARNGFKSDSLEKQQGDLLVSYDWAQPISQSIAVAATLNQEIGNKKDPIEGAANIAAAGLGSGIEALSEQPFLQGMAELFGGNPNTTAGDRLARILEGVPASFAPGLLNQIRQATANRVPETYSPNPAQRAMNKVIGRLPFVSKTLPEAYKTLGATPREQFQAGSNSLFNVFLNPAFVAKYNLDPVVEAVLEPYQAEGRAKQFPQVAKKTLRYTDPQGEPVELPLKGEDISRLQRLMGMETEKAFLTVNLSELRAMTYEEQEAVLAKLVNQAASRARDLFLVDKGIKYATRDMKRAFQAMKK